VGILVKGKLIASGTISDLEQQLLSQEEQMELELKAVPWEEKLAGICETIDGVDKISWQNDMLLLECHKDIREDLVRELIASNYCPTHLALRGVSLDSIYLRYFHKEEEYHGKGS